MSVFTSLLADYSQNSTALIIFQIIIFQISQFGKGIRVLKKTFIVASFLWSG